MQRDSREVPGVLVPTPPPPVITSIPSGAFMLPNSVFLRYQMPKHANMAIIFPSGLLILLTGRGKGP